MSAGEAARFAAAQAPSVLVAGAVFAALKQLAGMPCDSAAAADGLRALLCSAQEHLSARNVVLDVSVGPLLLGIVLGATLLWALARKAFSKAPVYVVDFTVFNPPPRCGTAWAVRQHQTAARGQAARPTAPCSARQLPRTAYRTHLQSVLCAAAPMPSAQTQLRPWASQP
jgi:hypothetical protein